MPRVRLLAALLAAVVLAACGDGNPRVSLKTLTDEQTARDGDNVVVEGRVRKTDEPLHYWLTDGDYNRVGLRPDDAVAEHVGQRVTVRGRFSYSRDEGRWIEVAQISPAAGATE